ncbi:MAG: thioesterase [Erysipelotrichales bacterium]|nr:thioesterase [Erysipelotrichales bacterium]
MYTIKSEVRLSQAGHDGKMKLVSAVDLLQDCANSWIDNEKILKDYMTKSETGVFLTFRQLEVIRRPFYGEKLTTKSGVYLMKGFFGHRSTVIYDENNKPCLKCYTIGAFINLKAGNLIRLQEDIVNSVTYDEKVPMVEYADKKIILPNEKFETLEPLAILFNDIDFYKHVNNARYIEKALNLLPLDFEVKHLRIEYKRAAKFGDLLYPKRLISNNHCFILFNDIEEKPYAIIEMKK